MAKTERQKVKRKEWERRIAKYRESGKSVRQWCAENNVSAERLWYWLRRYKANNDAPPKQSNQWLPVEVCEHPPVGKDNSLTIRVGKASIEVKEGFDPALLSQVVRTLVASC